MKTFSDLKEGDSVYYWDKGKIHAQKIRKIITQEKSKYNNWDNKIDTEKRTKIYLYRSAGPIEIVSYNGEIYDYGCDYQVHKVWHGITKYSCLEALKKWLKQRKDYVEGKALKYYLRYEKLSKMAEKYENALNG